MTMIAATSSPRRGQGLRRVNLQRDLLTIADLIEVCFAETLDAGGRATIREMRALSRLGPLLYVMAATDDLLKGIGHGFVWEEAGHIVGNVTLFPARYPTDLGRVYIIANVAVHPEFRRRGIARRLMDAALDAIHEGQGRAAILQVEQRNDGARRLYEQMGFATQRVWSEWRRSGQISPPPRTPQRLPITTRPGRDWQTEYALAGRVFPAERGGLGWNRPLHPREFHRSPAQHALDFLTGSGTERWIAREGTAIAGSLWAQSRFGGGVRLTLIVPEERREAVTAPLLAYGLRRLALGYRPMVIEHPVDDAIASAALRLHHFHVRRTLAHMRLEMG